MELKGVKPGVFHPRCVACKEKFLLEIFADAGRAPVVAAEHDAKAETISPGRINVVANPQAANRGATSNVQTIAPMVTRAVARDVRETSVAINAGRERSRMIVATGGMPDDLDAHIVGATIGGYHITQR